MKMEIKKTIMNQIEELVCKSHILKSITTIRVAFGSSCTPTWNPNVRTTRRPSVHQRVFSQAKHPLQAPKEAKPWSRTGSSGLADIKILKYAACCKSNLVQWVDLRPVMWLQSVCLLEINLICVWVSRSIIHDQDSAWKYYSFSDTKLRTNARWSWGNTYRKCHVLEGEVPYRNSASGHTRF